MAPSSRMISLLLGGRLIDYTGPLPPWKGRCFVLTGIDAPSGYNLAKTSTHELADVLFPITVLHTAWLSARNLLRSE